MALPTTYADPNTLDRTTGQNIPASYWEQLLANQRLIGGTGGYIGARVYNSANISLANNTTTALTFNSESYDSDPTGSEIHSTTVNTSRLTCRTAGKYLVWGGVYFDANATGQRNVQIRVNGTIPYGVEARLNNGAAYSTIMTVTAIVTLAAADYVELTAHQDSGGALNVIVGSSYSPEFGMIKI